MAVNTVGTIDDRVKVKTALMSLSDKSGLDAFARALKRVNSTILFLSTGGTHAALQTVLGESASRTLRQVSEYTGQPEMQGGLVKTLDFKIYLGLLSETYNASHAADLARTGAATIDLVVANLYPFEQAVARAGATLEDARSNIDIGGPCMVRAAAKNFHRVSVLTDPADYPGFVEELEHQDGAVSLATRYRLAQKAFRLIARYDEAIARYLEATPLAASRSVYSIRNGD
jgi:phosphoribosylaminoimidazolecarboxamide formyltransferase/IMP cyclohydrolase